MKTIVQMASERPVLKVVADQYGCPTSAQDLAQVITVLLLTAAVRDFARDQRGFV